MKRLILFLSALALLPGAAIKNSSTPVASKENSVRSMRKAEAKSGSQTLRVLNWEDYIYVAEGEEDLPDMTDQFIEWMHENHPEYPDVKVTYSTTDTNETMLNELSTGKAHYDLICPSDYGIQKLMAADSLVEIKPIMERLGLKNYETYASPKLLEYLNGITAESNSTGETYNLTDYAVGYMWGTLGLIFNPEFELYQAKGYTSEEVVKDMEDWSALWNEKYHGSISAKDSMRDTYFIAEAETFKDELIYWLEKYENNEIDLATYNAAISEILNRCDDENIAKVKETLKKLKKNIFGLEVDSGKQDIVVGYVGINTAWSGDSVYSMDLADEYNKTRGYEPEYGLCYSVPYTGANIWFDGWCMPKDDTRSPAQEEIAMYFLDFMSHPDNASQNTNYIGYTSFIGGDSMLDLIKDWYDIRTEYIYYVTEDEEYLSLYYIDPETNEETEVWYDAFHLKEDEDSNYDEVKLYYYVDEEKVELEDETYNTRFLISKDEEGELYIGEGEDSVYLQEVDLSYFFNGTLSEYQDNIDTIFYTDEYYVSYHDENDEEVLSRTVGRQFYCQFPDEKTISRCVIMADYGKQNDAIRKMWEDFKANDISVAMVVIISLEGALIVGGILYFAIRSGLTKKLRRARRGQK